MSTTCCKSAGEDHSKHKHMCVHTDGAMHEVAKDSNCEHKNQSGFEGHKHVCLHEAYEHGIKTGEECLHEGLHENHVDVCVHSDGKEHEIVNSECCANDDDCEYNEHNGHKHVCRHSEYKHPIHETIDC